MMAVMDEMQMVVWFQSTPVWKRLTGSPEELHALLMLLLGKYTHGLTGQ